MLNPVDVSQLPNGWSELPYVRAPEKFSCDLCNWAPALAAGRVIDFYLCDEHARELGHLW